MKLSKEEIGKILEEYSLGSLNEIKPIWGGAINHNFIFRTDKGEFIVRILGYKMDRYWTNQKELEFKVLEHLIAKKFLYGVPRFLKNKKKSYLTKIGKKLIEVYPRIKGRLVVKQKEIHIKEMAKALALYHKTMESFRIPKKFKRISNLKWIKQELKEMKEIKPRNSLDKLMLENVDIFIEALKKMSNASSGGMPVICHADFHRWNLIFKGNKLTGILDFENVNYRPRVSDIYFDANNLEYSLLFVKEYNKYNKLTKSEINNIIHQRIIGSGHHFRWAYRGTMKNKKNRISQLKAAINKYKKSFEFEKVLLKELR